MCTLCYDWIFNITDGICCTKHVVLFNFVWIHWYSLSDKICVSTWFVTEGNERLMRNRFIRRLPWNQQKFNEWIEMMAFTMIGSVWYWFLMGVFSSFFASFCEYHKAFHMKFKYLIDQMNQSHKFLCDDGQRIEHIISELIFHHVQEKKWVDKSVGYSE